MATTFNKINLSPLPNQTLKVNLKINNNSKEETITFNLFFSYREVCKYWTLTIRDNYNNDILSNIPLLTGGGYLEMGNILKQFGYKNIGGFLIYKTNETDLDSPDEYTLGTDFQLVWCSDATNYEVE